MDQGSIDSGAINCICEAVDCFETATDKIAVQGGKFGVISVLVCRNCIGKFQDNGIRETKAKIVHRKRGAMI
jgi:hypothetical protein